MKILFLSDNFPPEVNAPASRTFEHCREWVKAGHDVTVITTAPNFPKGVVFPGYRNRLWQREEMEGIRVVRVWTYITANAGFGKRTLDYLSFMVSGFLAGLVQRRPDVIVGTSPQFFTTCAAWMLAVFRWRPFVFELRDLWPESIKTVGAMNESAALRALERLELFLYRKASAVVAVTASFKRNLISRGIAGDKIAVVTNGVDLSRFRPLPPDLALRDALGIPHQAFVAGYIGTHGMAHALETVLEAARMLGAEGDVGPTPDRQDTNSAVLPASNTPVIPAGKPESSAMDGKAAVNNHGAAPVRGPTIPGLGPGFPAGTTEDGGDAGCIPSVIPAGKPESSAMDGKAAVTNHGAAPRRGPTIHFILLGDGARKEALKAQAANLGLTNVHFLDSVPKAEVPRYWSLLDVAIIHLRQADNFTQVIPSKLFECMGMGIPVLHGVAGESAGIVTREEVGLVFPPEDAQALRDGVLRLAEDPALYQRLKANCLAAAPRYERASLARQMLAVLEAVAGKAGTVSVTG